MYILIGAAALIAGIVISAILFYQLWQTAETRRRKRGGLHAAEKRRMEFSKLLALWAAIIATTSVIASYVLAAFDKQTASDVAITVFTACVGYLITYAAKSAYEKNSRNKHGLDADGNPLPDAGGMPDMDGNPEDSTPEV